MANLAVVNGRWVNLEKPGGAVFFVSGGTVAYGGKGGSDNNKGTTPQEPLATIDGTAGAHSKCVAGRGDTIVLLPGSVTITAAIALDVADVTLTGYTVTGPNTYNPSLIVCATASVEMINIDADNVVVENLTLDCNIGSSSAGSYPIDVSDTTATTGVILRNLFIDMEGADTDTDAIRIGDGTVVAKNFLIEGCTIHDADRAGIVLSAASDEGVVRNCHIYDSVTTNVMTTGIDSSCDNVLLERNIISTVGGTSCIAITAAEEAMLVDNRLHANGADTIGITIADNQLPAGLGNFIIAGAAGNLIDFAAATDNYAGFNDFGVVTAADPSAGGFITPTVTGS